MEASGWGAGKREVLQMNWDIPAPHFPFHGGEQQPEKGEGSRKMGRSLPEQAGGKGHVFTHSLTQSFMHSFIFT